MQNPAAKLGKLAQGRLDLHSSRSPIDLSGLAALAREAGGDAALEALQLAQAAGVGLPKVVARRAWETGAQAPRGAELELEIMVFDRAGAILARTGFVRTP
ncbi:MAG TPA: hypothetical protein VK446_16145 [Methylocystis sp.]|nr:hypothetical protein [Methylocystis sp.]